MAAFPKFLLDTTVPQYLTYYVQGQMQVLGEERRLSVGVLLEKGEWGLLWKLCDWGP